jgi:hypothetical protein
MAGLVSRIPYQLTARPAGSGAASYALTDIDYDVALGGIPFLLGVSDERSMSVGLAPIRKEQFDNNREPGEQSLLGWWLRSQSTWIGGEGMLYQDPDQVNAANLQNRHAIQYGHSVGLNPWVNGQLSMLRSTSQRIADASGNPHLLLGWNDGTDRYWSAVGNVLKSDTGSAVTTITWGGSGTIKSLTSDGTNYFAADATGIYKGAGNGAGALAWNTGNASVAVKWVKGRLMAGIGASVYELVGGTPPTLPTAKMTHLNSAWTWTDFAEGPSAIYAAGFAGSQSSIYKFTLDTSTGAVPTLASGGAITAQLPQGEILNCINVYLGTFVGLGTSRGFRVGQIDSNGDISYGPLLIANANGVKAVGTYDRFFFVGGTNSIDGSSGLHRVDLGQIIQDASSSVPLFAYATDLQAHVTGAVSAVTNLGNSDRMAFAVVGQGAYLESSSTLEPTAYFQTGRVRFSTLEPKIFKFLTVRTPANLMGSVTASVIDPGGGSTSVLTVSQGAGTSIADVILSAPAGAVEWLQLRLDFARSAGDATQGAVINGWQLKAMPGSVRQRIFEVPLSCFDFEAGSSGQEFGYEGRAAEILAAVSQMGQKGDAVTFKDLASDTSALVVIDDLKYEQMATPSQTSIFSGGYLYVQLRTIADVIAS